MPSTGPLVICLKILLECFDLRRSSPNIDQISRRNEISRICQLCIGIDIYRRIDPFTTIRFTLPLLQIRAGKIQRSQFRTTSYGHSNNRPTILYRHGFDLRTFIQFDTLRPNLRTGRTFHQRNINRSQIDITNSQIRIIQRLQPRHLQRLQIPKIFDTSQRLHFRRIVGIKLQIRNPISFLLRNTPIGTIGLNQELTECIIFDRIDNRTRFDNRIALLLDIDSFHVESSCNDILPEISRLDNAVLLASSVFKAVP